LSFALTFPLRKRSYGWQANLLKSRRCRRYFSPLLLAERRLPSVALAKEG
jgi:hypothetical protein